MLVIEKNVLFATAKVGEVEGSPELARTIATMPALIAWGRSLCRTNLRLLFQSFL